MSTTETGTIKKAEEFVAELQLLCERYDIYIGGCGCCGSPWAASPDNDDDRKKYKISDIDRRTMRGGKVWVDL